MLLFLLYFHPQQERSCSLRPTTPSLYCIYSRMKMSYSQLYFSAFLALLMFSCFSTATGETHGKFRAKRVNLPTIFVDPSGHGNCSTIQCAIDFVPPNNRKWVRIYVKAGRYREKIQIPYDKPHIYIQGEGKWKTRVIWGDHGSIATSATFTSQADNIVVKSITFINSYNHPPESNRNPIAVAVAATIAGDKSAFYRCGFLGVQDTIWDVQGRHYFKLCSIQGAIDFIFGAGQSIYERCTISVLAGALRGLTGFITAQGRSDPSDANGFVFKNCKLTGNGRTFLGRPWRNYARVIFYNSSMSHVVVPKGWDPGPNAGGQEHQLVFAEDSCHGVGSMTSKRVTWEHKLSPQMLNQFINISFVDEEGWISSQPFNMLGF